MTDSIVTVTDAATSYDLTTLAHVKEEIDVTNGTSDVVLQRYITSASKAAANYCDRVFAVETLSEEFLPDCGRTTKLQLARYPLISVTSVTEDDVLLVEGTDYLVNSSNGQLTRISDGEPTTWSDAEITVVYSSGYATTPEDLEDAVIRMVTKRYSAKGRDTTLRQESIPGVREATYWIATGEEAGNMAPDVVDILNNYRTMFA